MFFDTSFLISFSHRRFVIFVLIATFLDSSLWDVSSDDKCSFYEGVRAIHDVTHPDITTPMNGEDILPTYLIPYNFPKSPSKKRFLSRDTLALKRKHSSSSSVNFDTTLKNQ